MAGTIRSSLSASAIGTPTHGSEVLRGFFRQGPPALTLARAPSMSAGLALAIPAYAAYNYLVSRVNAIVLDMEKAATLIGQAMLRP